MALAKALGGGFPVGACLATREAAKGMTAGTHGSTFGGNPLAMALANAVLDVMLAPRISRARAPKRAALFKQRLAEIKDRYPSVIAEVRGEGLLIGLRAVVPAGELVDALRAEKMIAVAAGDNVVRLLPPLIVDERGDRRGGRAHRPRLRRGSTGRTERAAHGRGGTMSPVRHFLDLIEVPAADLRGIIERPRHEGKRRRRKRSSARRQDAGDDLRASPRPAPASRSRSPCASSAATPSC